MTVGGNNIIANISAWRGKYCASPFSPSNYIRLNNYRAAMMAHTEQVPLLGTYS